MARDEGAQAAQTGWPFMELPSAWFRRSPGHWAKEGVPGKKGTMWG